MRHSNENLPTRSKVPRQFQVAHASASGFSANQPIRNATRKRQNPQAKACATQMKICPRAQKFLGSSKWRTLQLAAFPQINISVMRRGSTKIRKLKHAPLK